MTLVLGELTKESVTYISVFRYGGFYFFFASGAYIDDNCVVVFVVCDRFHPPIHKRAFLAEAPGLKLHIKCSFLFHYRVPEEHPYMSTY